MGGLQWRGRWLRWFRHLLGTVERTGGLLSVEDVVGRAIAADAVLKGVVDGVVRDAVVAVLDAVPTSSTIRLSGNSSFMDGHGDGNLRRWHAPESSTPSRS